MAKLYAGTTSCCGEHRVCGADCNGAVEALCNECGVECCSKCASRFEHEERARAKCKACVPHHFKPFWTGDKCMTCGKPHPEEGDEP